MRGVSLRRLLPGLILGLCAPAGAEEFSVVGFEKVVVVAPAAQIVIGSAASNAATAMVRTSPLPQISWSAREDGKTLRLTASASTGAPRGGAPLKIDILGGGFAVDVHLHDGQVQVLKWARPVLVDLQKGKVTAKENRSGLSVQVGQGQIAVADQAGPLRVDLFKGDVGVSGLQGNLQLSGHQGDVKLDKANGSLQVQLYQGAVDVKGSGGSLQFQTGKAALVASGFKGRIEGQADEGNVNLGLVNETEAAVKTGTGRVTLDAKNSGSLLILRSEEGDITGTRNLRAGRDRGAQVLRGRVKGGDGGRIEVVAARGNIVVRE